VCVRFIIVTLPAADGRLHLEKATIGGFVLGTNSVGPLIDTWVGKQALVQMREVKSKLTLLSRNAGHEDILRNAGYK
jgi:hypothetical protein